MRLHVERTILASPERVFAWMAAPASLTAAPMVLRAAWTPASPAPGVGAVREVLTTGTWFREEITAYDPPHSFSYRIIRSFPTFDHQGGTLTFTPVAGGTHVDWVTSYTHPLRAGGKVLEAITSRLLPRSFNAILAGCARDVERE